MSMELRVDSKGLQQAMAAGPAVLEKHMARAIWNITQEMARDARRRAPKASSELVDAIIPSQPSPFEGLVSAGKDYARMVEEGTQPDGKIPGKRADSERYKSILDWVTVGSGVTPNDPSMSKEDLAYIIARSIALKGTPAQPFMAPAFENNKARAERRINNAINAALKEISR